MEVSLPSEKSMRTSLRKQVRNRSVRSATRTYVAKAIRAIDELDESQRDDAVKRALKALDQTAKRGIIHANNAARRKSRLMKRLNAASQD
jgi:small subunit ribosomal protein S20